jgi:hypothetical protein
MDSVTTAEAPAQKKSALPPGLKPAGMTIAGACEFFPASKPIIYEWINTGLLEVYSVGSQTRVSVESAEWLKNKLIEIKRNQPSKSKQMSELRKMRELKRAK